MLRRILSYRQKWHNTLLFLVFLVFKSNRIHPAFSLLLNYDRADRVFITQYSLLCKSCICDMQKFKSLFAD